MSLPSASAKISLVLRVVFLAFLCIILRIWHLSFIQRDAKWLEAQKPQQRAILVRADRGTICDRFGIPLAVNRIRYNAAVYYGQIAQIPSVSWKTDAEGKRVRSLARKEYIKELSVTLGKALSLDPERIEDLIHSKAALFPHVPFIVKGGISEEEHYRLKMLEKDWLGIHAEIAAERFYPLGKTACSLIGTLGAINGREYNAIAGEIALLQEAVRRCENLEQGFEAPPPGHDSFDTVYSRLAELKEKAYAMNDLVGKTGVEAQFEEDLRGFFGKKYFEVDQKGRLLRELPGGREAIPGRNLVLSLSAELQQFAEELLARSEKTREASRKTEKQSPCPLWIKGGAIAALDPNTGEVLALASYPRFDPNDFIPSGDPAVRKSKHARICRWLENDRFLGAVWDGRELLPGGASEPKLVRPLDWETYLNAVLPPNAPLRALFERVDDVKGAIQIQEDFETLLYFSRSSDPRALLDALFPGNASSSTSSQISGALREAGSDAAQSRKRIEASLGPLASNDDRLFAIDLCRMAIHSPAFTDPLIACVGTVKLSAYRSLGQALQRLEAELKQEAQKNFRSETFSAWRKENQKAFLAEKRQREKELQTYARPYIDYLDQKERELFSLYWEEHRIPLILSELKREPFAADASIESLRQICARLPSPLAEEFLRTFRSFSQLDRPLLGTYKRLRHAKQVQTEKDLAAAFYPVGGFGFFRSFAYQTGLPPGSLFKLVTACEGLRQGYSLTLFDETALLAQGREAVAFTLNRAPYPRFYKGGRLPKSHAPQLGKVDLVGALEQSSNPYFAILAGDGFQHPSDLNGAAAAFGYGAKTGIDLPGENPGNLPTDLETNRTGLYSTAIGQHTLLATPLQAAGMLATLANGGRVLKPKLVKEERGLARDEDPLNAFGAVHYFAREELQALGIPFPLFTSVHPRTPSSAIAAQHTEVRRVLPLDPEARGQLLEGMERVVWGAKGSARPAIVKTLLNNPSLLGRYLSLHRQMIGKTGTAEVVFNPYPAPSSKPQIAKHVWFGAISFPPDASSKAQWDRPELVVVVALRYGDAGKEAAPLAAEMIHKWREIKKKRGIADF